MLHLDENYDVVIFGAGINGCAITAELAQRGLKVINVEVGNIAGGTSSNSTSLIHGGLRYLEQYDFAMVRRSLDERQELLELAPHLVRAQQFLIPRNTLIKRPFWLVRLGLLLYDNLSFKNKLPSSKYLQKKQAKLYFDPLKPQYTAGLMYYDGITDDARLTITKALQAKQYGAKFLQHTELLSAQFKDDAWDVAVHNKKAGKLNFKAKFVVNATGSAVKNFAEQKLQLCLDHSISLVKGSHIILPKLYAGDHAYLLQNYDQRVIFVTPFHGLSMVGTTDVYFSDCKEKVQISKDEINYLLAAVRLYFKVQINETDILGTRSGLRVLIANPGAEAFKLSRDYALELSDKPAKALHVIGGKLTAHSQLALQVADKLKVFFPNMQQTRKSSTYLPGGIYIAKDEVALENTKFAEYLQYAKVKYSWLDPKILTRYLQSYGTRTENILIDCKAMRDLGINFADTYYQVEIDYLIREEFVADLVSLLWLHTKLGLYLTQSSKQNLLNYIKNKFPEILA